MNPFTSSNGDLKVALPPPPQKVENLVLGIVISFAVFGFFSCINRTGDFIGYIQVGNILLNGGHIYLEAPKGTNTWPPFFSLFCVPLSLLDRPTPYLARGVWLLFNFFMLWAVIRLTVKVVYGQTLQIRASSLGPSIATIGVLVPIFMTIRFIASNYQHLQINIFIFFLALLGLHVFSRGKDWWGALLIGFAASLKVMPVLFIPYFIYKRY